MRLWSSCEALNGFTFCFRNVMSREDLLWFKGNRYTKWSLVLIYGLLFYQLFKPLFEIKKYFLYLGASLYHQWISADAKKKLFFLFNFVGSKLKDKDFFVQTYSFLLDFIKHRLFLTSTYVNKVLYSPNRYDQYNVRDY